MNLKIMATACSALLGLAACTGPTPDLASKFGVLRLPNAKIQQVLAGPPGTIYYLYREAGDSKPSLGRVDAGGASSKVPLPPMTNCDPLQVVSITLSANGRPGATVSCAGGGNVYVEIDDDNFPTRSTVLPTGSAASWIQSRGISWLQGDDGLCQGIAPFVHGAVQRFPHVSPSTAIGWPIDSVFLKKTERDCRMDGRVAYVATSSQNGLYLLATSLPASERYSEAASWSLYYLDLEKMSLRQVLSDLQDPDGVVVRRNGMVLITAEYDNRQGLWQIDPEKSSIVSLVESDFGAISSSADQQWIVLVRESVDGDQILRLPEAALDAGLRQSR